MTLGKSWIKAGSAGLPYGLFVKPTRTGRVASRPGNACQPGRTTGQASTHLSHDPIERAMGRKGAAMPESNERSSLFSIGDFIPRRRVPYDPEFLGIFTLRQLEAIPASDLPFARVANRIVYRRSDLRRYVDARMSDAPVEARVAAAVVNALATAGMISPIAGRPGNVRLVVPTSHVPTRKRREAKS